MKTFIRKNTENFTDAINMHEKEQSTRDLSSMPKSLLSIPFCHALASL